MATGTHTRSVRGRRSARRTALSARVLGLGAAGGISIAPIGGLITPEIPEMKNRAERSTERFTERVAPRVEPSRGGRSAADGLRSLEADEWPQRGDQICKRPPRELLGREESRKSLGNVQEESRNRVRVWPSCEVWSGSCQVGFVSWTLSAGRCQLGVVSWALSGERGCPGIDGGE